MVVESKETGTAAMQMRGRKDERGGNIKQRETVAENLNKRKGRKNMKVNLISNSPCG